MLYNNENHQPTKDTAVVILGDCSDSRAKMQPMFGEENLEINRRFWSTLKKNVVKSAEQARIPFVFCKDQECEPAADNLAVEISNLFDEGWDKLILVGVNTPNLSAETLAKSTELLKEKDWVIEPSETEGVNVLGLKAENFQLDEFRLLPWTRDGFFHEFVSYIRTLNQSLSILPSNPSFTDRASLEQWLENSPNKVLSLVIKGLLFKENYKKKQVEVACSTN